MQRCTANSSGQYSRHQWVINLNQGKCSGLTAGVHEGLPGMFTTCGPLQIDGQGNAVVANKRVLVTLSVFRH